MDGKGCETRFAIPGRVVNRSDGHTEGAVTIGCKAVLRQLVERWRPAPCERRYGYPDLNGMAKDHFIPNSNHIPTQKCRLLK